MTNDCDTRSVAEWLLAGAPSAATLDQVLEQLCERLVGRGVPLWRVALFVRTLHPELMGRRLVWRQGEAVAISEAAMRFAETPEFRESPVARVYLAGVALRRRLVDGAGPLDFPLLHELRAAGVTDYLASPLAFTNGEIHVVTWTTRTPAGFADAQIAGLEAVVPPLARLVEIYALRRVASNLLSTYVGHQTGGRILAGQIRRGHTEAIHAAIWLSDMRGFTALADRLPPRTLIDLLNRYFACQVPAIERYGGEVLKFIGDGLLAIFPLVDDHADGGEVCSNALAAACEARASVAALGGSAAADVFDDVRFGLALHLGEVLYGNIGGGNRLDFTCIGPTVNLAARLEKVAGTLGRSIVASQPFAERCPRALSPIGNHVLSGFGGPQMVYGLPEEVA